MKEQKVKFQYTVHHGPTCFEFDFQVEATIYPGTPAIRHRDGSECAQHPDEAYITGVWAMGGSNISRMVSEKLLRQFELAAIEEYYNRRNVRAYAVSDQN